MHSEAEDGSYSKVKSAEKFKLEYMYTCVYMYSRRQTFIAFCIFKSINKYIDNYSLLLTAKINH